MSATKKGPEQSGPVDSKVVLGPGTIAGATPGNRIGNAEAYGIAAALLKARRQLPDELAQWLATRLDSLSRYLIDHPDKNYSGTNKALGIVALQRGTKPANQLSTAERKQLAWEVYYAGRDNPTMDVGALCEFVAKRRLAEVTATHRTFPGRLVSLNTAVSMAKVKAAWANRKSLDPDIPELARRPRVSWK